MNSVYVVLHTLARAVAFASGAEVWNGLTHNLVMSVLSYMTD
jgi:hypothetical protein